MSIAGIGTAKRAAFEELADPVTLALMRRIKAAFDPAGILNPGTIFSPGPTPSPAIAPSPQEVPPT